MELICTSQYRLGSPAFDPSGQLFLACSATGALLSLNGKILEPFFETQGAISGLAFDPANSDAFLCDSERQAVLKIERDTNSGAPTVVDFIHQFEGRSLIGPQRLRFTPNGELVFTDGGRIGETSLTNPSGCVYRTVQHRQQLLRMCSGVAGPSGVAVNPSNGAVYVCETSLNRILRFTPRPDGHYLSSVWVQLQGSLGPIDIDVNPINGDVYVAKFDIDGFAPSGHVVVYSAVGEERGSIVVPSPEISGVAVDPNGTALYITVSPLNGDVASALYRVPLQGA